MQTNTHQADECRTSILRLKSSLSLQIQTKGDLERHNVAGEAVARAVDCRVRALANQINALRGAQTRVIDGTHFVAGLSTMCP